MGNKRKISGCQNQPKSSALARQVKRQKEREEEKQAHQSSDASNYDDTGHFITMSPVTLEGNTLGERRKHFNKLVEDAIANKHELFNIRADDSDIENLLKIDIASKTRNVDYIMQVIKSNDMLYAATAIKKSTWLITEQQYANIINPEYLHTQLLPSMNTKTFNKLMLHIRLNLKDERRVESFYQYLKESGSAYKWLQNCSIPFIENVIKNGRLIPLSLLKRLCRRSAHIIEYYYTPCSRTFAPLFLLKSRTEEVMKIIRDGNYFPFLGKKRTEILMKNVPYKVIDDFEYYIHKLDLSVVAKYLKKREKIKSFLYEQAQKGFQILYFRTLSHFVKQMPEEERFEFVKKYFIEKTELDAFCPKYKTFSTNSDIKSYQWYEFAPFDEAFTELKKLIRKENLSSERCAMLSVLITCANKNHQHIKTLLNYFKEKHINELLHNKTQFVNDLISQISTHEFDDETWNDLDQLFHSMEVYTESENDAQLCFQSIVLYKVLHDKPVPKIVEQKMSFDTFENIQRKLNEDQKGKIFTYLLNSVLTKIQNKNIANESDANETIVHLKNVLNLLKVWKIDISKYAFILEKIREIVKIKQEKKWKTDISCLYNVKKSWRKHMFEESLSLYLCEETCLNALKHKPQLLMRHEKEIDTLRKNESISLRRLLAKLRVYWPQSLAQHWTNAYLLNLNKLTGQKAAVRGLFMLLPQKLVIDMARKHAPDDFTINWGETDQADVSIRKNIAKNLHVARPLIPIDTVLWYGKGDYLQYALQSLNAIFSVLSEVESREHVSKLLEASVPLQNFGLRLALVKLKYDEQRLFFPKIWSTTKNQKIRSVLFNYTHAQLCKVKNPTLEKDLWELLSFFMNNLSTEESTDVYRLVAQAENIPITVRAEYYMKSYMFLTSLPTSANCETYVERLIQFAPTIMDSLDENFVFDNMLAPAGSKFVSFKSEFLNLFACYLLCGKSEEEQLQRFKILYDRAIDEAFQLWNSASLKDRRNVRKLFDNFLNNLVLNFRTYYVTLKEIPIPVKLFVEILTKMEKNISLIDNYVLYTSWKLTIEYFKSMKELSSSFKAFESYEFAKYDSEESYSYFVNKQNQYRLLNDAWSDIHNKVSPSLGPIIVKCLKEDIELHNIPTIYCPFTMAIKKMLKNLVINSIALETLKYMLNDCEFVPCYLVVSKMISDGISAYVGRGRIREKIKSHPSAIVRML